MLKSFRFRLTRPQSDLSRFFQMLFLSLEKYIIQAVVLASIDAMKQTYVIVILAYFTFFQPNLH